MWFWGIDKLRFLLYNLTMKSSNHEQIENACTFFCNLMAESTLKMVETNTNLPLAQRKAFATGMMCAIDAIKSTLLPTLQSVIEENPKSFENLN